MISTKKSPLSSVSSTSVMKQFQVILFCVLISGFTATVSAQGRPLRYGIGAECLSTGSGLKGFSSAYVSVSSKYNQLAIGAMIQNNSNAVDGIRMVYTRNLSGTFFQKDLAYPGGQGTDLIELSGSAYFQYSQNAALSKAEVLASERINRRNEPLNFNSLRLNTAEGGAGIELRVNFTERLVWRNYVGAGFYYHLNYQKGLYMDKKGTSLLAGTGIQFSI